MAARRIKAGSSWQIRDCGGSAEIIYLMRTGCGGCTPWVIVTAVGNAAEGIPRGHIRGGRDPLAGGTRTEMQHYTAHVTWPRRLAARVTARSGMDKGCGATIFQEVVVNSGRRVGLEMRSPIYV